MRGRACGRLDSGVAQAICKEMKKGSNARISCSPAYAFGPAGTPPRATYVRVTPPVRPQAPRTSESPRRYARRSKGLVEGAMRCCANGGGGGAVRGEGGCVLQVWLGKCRRTPM